MLSTGLILGALSWLGFIITWNHFPLWLKRFSVNHPLLTDAITTLLTWFTISSITQSLVGVIACVVTGLLMEITMTLIRNKIVPVDLE